MDQGGGGDGDIGLPADYVPVGKGAPAAPSENPQGVDESSGGGATQFSSQSDTEGSELSTTPPGMFGMGGGRFLG